MQRDNFLNFARFTLQKPVVLKKKNLLSPKMTDAYCLSVGILKINLKYLMRKCIPIVDQY